MPFLNQIDLITLSRKMKDIIFRPFPLVPMPVAQYFPSPNLLAPFQYFLCTKEHCVKFVDLFVSSSLLEVLRTNEEDVKTQLTALLNGHTDLIPNQYEGGFKVWEGLYDLIDYVASANFAILDRLMASRFANSTNDDININILDLGCGSGLLSIFIAAQLRHRYPTAKFKLYLQDYNENVIKYYTIPNVIVNDILYPLTAITTPDEMAEPTQFARLVATMEKSYRFMHGDWSEIGDELRRESVKFDLVLSAETLYAEANYEKLYNIFDTLLADDGFGLIATKSHYFGVGGGTWSFLEYARERANQQQQPQAQVNQSINCNRPLETNVVHEIEANLLRHIIQLNRR